MSFEPLKRLAVWRTRADGSRCRVGTLAQNLQGVFFAYDPDYLKDGANLSPFKLDFASAPQPAPRAPHQGLHGVFADSIPDGWGLLLMDRVFRQAGILPAQITAMDRLAFVGKSGMGALSYEPVSAFSQADDGTLLCVGELGLQAQAVFDGHTREVLAALVAAGNSGGARPKAQLYLDADHPDTCGTRPQAGRRPYLVKFTSAQLALGHEEGLCEAVYLRLAATAGIEVPGWRLLEAPARSGAKHWLALARFDTVQPPEQQHEGRLHLHSACALLDADFRLPSLDYEDLIKASSLLCKSPAAGQQQFRRSIFNLFALNQGSWIRCIGTIRACYRPTDYRGLERLADYRLEAISEPLQVVNLSLWTVGSKHSVVDTDGLSSRAPLAYCATPSVKSSMNSTTCSVATWCNPCPTPGRLISCAKGAWGSDGSPRR